MQSIRTILKQKEKCKNIIKKKAQNLFPDEIRNKFKNILIDIHGGAFIASTSSYHQSKIKSLFEKNG